MHVSANVTANRNFQIWNKLKSFFEKHENLNCTLDGSLEKETEHLTTDLQEEWVPQSGHQLGLSHRHHSNTPHLKKKKKKTYQCTLATIPGFYLQQNQLVACWAQNQGYQYSDRKQHTWTNHRELTASHASAANCVQENTGMILNKQHLTLPSALEDVIEFCHHAVCKMCTYLVLVEHYTRYCTLAAKLSLLIEHLTITQKE